MKKLTLLLFSFLIAGMQLLQAQGVVITGKATDATTGESLPGVTVVVKGSTVGTTSLADGTYRITVPAGGTTLGFSFIGYQTQEVAISGRTVIDVVMQEELQALQEIVVTGYSVERKKDIIGSVSVVNISDMRTTPSGSVTRQLQGRVSGVTVSSDGSVDNASKIRIRGFGSFGGSDPLYIIDGIPASVTGGGTTSSPIDRINPNDIESVQVLKDAASAAVYGARAANGVIIITTTQGKQGSAKFTVDAYSGVNYFPERKFPDMLSAQEWGDAFFLGMAGAGRVQGTPTWTHPQYGNGLTAVIPEYILSNRNNSRTGGFEISQQSAAVRADWTDMSKYDLATYQIVKSANTNWFAEAYNPAPVTNIQATASGGSTGGTYVVSLGYFDQKSTSDSYSFYRRYTLRANTTLNVKKFLKFGENIQVSYNEGRTVGNPAAIWTMQAIMPVWDEAGNPAGSAAPGVVAVGDTGRNPIGEAWRNRFDKNWTYAVFGNAFVDITPFKDLVIHSSFGIDYSARTTVDPNQRTYEHLENTSTNSINWAQRNFTAWTFTNTVNYSKTFGQHTVKLMLGTEANNNYQFDVNANRLSIPVETDPNFLYIDIATGTQTNGGTFSRNMLYSLLGRVDYTYSDKYLFNATVRRDGSSRFGINNRYGYFPSAAIGWRVSGEEFMSGLTWLSDLKLRASYGIIGNQNGLTNENQFTTVQQLINNSYPLQGTNNSIRQSYMIQRVGNPDARWEKSASFNLGLDASMYDGATAITFDYFIRKTTDLLTVNQAPYTGLDVSQPSINVGDIENKGIDITITQRAKIAGQVDIEASLNFSKYKNMVLKVLDNPAAALTNGNGRMGDATITRAGMPVSQFYGYQLDGFYNTQAEVDGYNAQILAGTYTNAIIPPALGRWKIKDVSGPNGVPDGMITDYDRTIIGSPHPDFQMGLNLTVSYKGIDLTGFLFWNQGGDLFNYTKYNTDFSTFSYNRSHRYLYDSWTPEKGNSALLPKLDISDTYSNRYVTSYFVESATYLRLNNLQLGYTLPVNIVKKLNIDRVRIYAQAQNLFTLTKFKGLDPGISTSGNDLAMGVVNNYTPTPQQILFGINIGF
jgi:TonB-linked SusC/RagA family outer membrane protein